MKAAAFDYHRPETKAEALAMLGTLENARLLAGGQSLIAMLNTRYVMLDHLIDLKRVPGMDGIEMGDGRVTIGALARQAAVMEDAELREAAPIFAEALRYVGHLQTRNRGTVGGSIAHMDPAAELMAVAAVLEATVHAESVRGARGIAIADYPVGYMTPKLEPNEMITHVSFRVPAKGHGWAFAEFVQRHGDFAIVGVAAILEGAGAKGAGTNGSGEAIGRARIALIGMGPAPVRLHEAEKMLEGERFSEEAARACGEVAGRVEAMSDTMASGTFRRKLAGVLTRRTLTMAAKRMGAGGRG